MAHELQRSATEDRLGNETLDATSAGAAAGSGVRRRLVVEGHVTRMGLAGICTILLGAWGGIVPFAGPAFGYHSTNVGSWEWNLQNALLYVVPGAVAIFAGLVMLGIVPSVRLGLGRLTAGVAGVLAMACGAWFVVGPVAWPTVHTGVVFQTAAPLARFANEVGYNLGVGVLLVLFGGMAATSGGKGRRLRATDLPRATEHYVSRQGA